MNEISLIEFILLMHVSVFEEKRSCIGGSIASTWLRVNVHNLHIRVLWFYATTIKTEVGSNSRKIHSDMISDVYVAWLLSLPYTKSIELRDDTLSFQITPVAF